MGKPGDKTGAPLAATGRIALLCPGRIGPPLGTALVRVALNPDPEWARANVITYICRTPAGFLNTENATASD